MNDYHAEHDPDLKSELKIKESSDRPRETLSLEMAGANHEQLRRFCRTARAAGAVALNQIFQRQRPR